MGCMTLERTWLSRLFNPLAVLLADAMAFQAAQCSFSMPPRFGRSCLFPCHAFSSLPCFPVSSLPVVISDDLPYMTSTSILHGRSCCLIVKRSSQCETILPLDCFLMFELFCCYCPWTLLPRKVFEEFRKMRELVARLLHKKNGVADYGGRQ